jgi:DNA-binding PadR family transcriptional regulator
VSYVVLGLIARDGPSTPYALKAAVGRGIGHFWQFPHSQIYAETGRRWRSYRITAEGRAALSAWLAEPGDIAELARVQADLHRQTVDYTREIIARLEARDDLPGRLAVAELMGDALRVMGEHWERIGRALAEPPGPAAAAGGR